MCKNIFKFFLKSYIILIINRGFEKFPLENANLKIILE